MHLVYAPRRVVCEHYGGTHVELLLWVAGKRRFTSALMVTLATWARVLTWKQVAGLFRCSWSTVASAVDAAETYGLAHRDLSEVTHIGSARSCANEVTCMSPMNSRCMLWSGEGRTKETLEEFFDWFAKERTKRLEGVCCDIWQPYTDVVKARAPKAVLVFDEFHIVQHLSEAVDQVRRDEIREKGQDHKQLMTKTRYIWLKNPWNLADKQREQLPELEQLNLKINRAYLLKEAFREFWRTPVVDGPSIVSTSGFGGRPILACNRCETLLGCSVATRRTY